METILILVGSAPGSDKAIQALSLARGFRAHGARVGICLLQDAVLGAVASNPQGEGWEEFNFVRVIGEDLTLRGFSKADLRTDFDVCDFDWLVDQMMEKVDKVLGVF